MTDEQLEIQDDIWAEYCESFEEEDEPEPWADEMCPAPWYQ